MKTYSIVLGAIAAVALLLGSRVLAEGHKVKWGYEGQEGPQRWGDLAPEFATCKTGQMQSPIDVSKASLAADVRIDIAYRAVPLTILNNGHTVEFTVENGSAITAHSKRYELLQVHFHTPSEHVIGGKAHPLEAHFVHKADDGSLAVIGLFFAAGAENSSLAGIFKHLPKQEAEPTRYDDVMVDARAILPAAPAFYRYMGSLTTPPCSEGVNWFVIKAVSHASDAQIAALHEAMGNNARPARPIGNRLLIEPR